MYKFISFFDGDRDGFVVVMDIEVECSVRKDWGIVVDLFYYEDYCFSVI